MARSSRKRPSLRTTESDPSVVALQAKLERLSSDRDPLEARLATLEHGLDDVTGSIRSQSEQRSTSVQTARAVNPPIIEPPLIPPMETLTHAKRRRKKRKKLWCRLLLKRRR